MSTLKNFIASQKASSPAPDTLDWPKRRDRWLAELDQLLRRTRGMLLAAGLEGVRMTDKTYEIFEHRLGAYRAAGLDIELPAGIVRFTPIGSVIIGAYGRVDVSGPNRRTIVKLILDLADEDGAAHAGTPPHEQEWAWRVYPGSGANTSYSFDEEGLGKLLESVSI